MGKPFIKLIRSPRAYYFFDVNKNQIVRIPEGTYHNLEQILNGESVQEDGTVRRLREMGYLSDFHVKEMEHPLTESLPELLGSKMKSLVLQITQSCNFRCSYCIYSNDYNEMQRGHSAKSMSMETAKAAIDYFAAHAQETLNPYIAFYGGEPLLEFQKIKALVAYAKEKFLGQDIAFTFTTNGSLLTPEIVDYCYENDIRFMLSMDGPEHIQNISRRFASNGRGSFQAIKDNFQYIQRKHSDYMDKLTVNMVIDQQNNYEDILQIFSDSIFGEIGKFMVSGIDDSYSIEKTVYTDEYSKKDEYEKFCAVVQYLETGSYTGKNWLAQQAVNQIYKTLQAFEKIEGLPEKGSHSGPCVPGQSKLFVNVEGDFYPCERVSENSMCMKIGNVKNGIDIDAVEKLLNIGKLNEEDCKNCWAFLHCGICVKYVDDCGRFSSELKKSYCDGVRKDCETRLKEYIMLKECGRGCKV